MVLFFVSREIKEVNNMSAYDTTLTDGKGNSLKLTGGNNLFRQLNNAIPKTTKDRGKIVDAGADYVKNQLAKNSPFHPHQYPSNDYLSGKERNPQHIKDAVTYLPEEYVDGSTDVGFSKQADPIAYWRDQGTYHHTGYFFVEDTYDNLDTDTLFGLEEVAFREYLNTHL